MAIVRKLLTNAIAVGKSVAAAPKEKEPCAAFPLQPKLAVINDPVTATE